MPIRIIKPPKTINVHLEWAAPNGEQHERDEEFPFSKFVGNLLSLPEWSKGWKAVKYAIEIEAAVDKATGGPFELSDGPYDMLRKVIEEPGPGGLGMSARVLRQVGPYFEAIVGAESK